MEGFLTSGADEAQQARGGDGLRGGGARDVVAVAVLPPLAPPPAVVPHQRTLIERGVLAVALAVAPAAPAAAAVAVRPVVGGVHGARLDLAAGVVVTGGGQEGLHGLRAGPYSDHTA